jgi:hypothetical protein
VRIRPEELGDQTKRYEIAHLDNTKTGTVVLQRTTGGVRSGFGGGGSKSQGT